ncbi:hypothetical protein, partial [Zavarzinella formosa]|uniref:hypothetical protein n=1 Tax=Zavarzinella formosa TaxID=360055 RepID=UPI00049760AB
SPHTAALVTAPASASEAENHLSRLRKVMDQLLLTGLSGMFRSTDKYDDGAMKIVHDKCCCSPEVA